MAGSFNNFVCRLNRLNKWHSVTCRENLLLVRFRKEFSSLSRFVYPVSSIHPNRNMFENPVLNDAMQLQQYRWSFSPLSNLDNFNSCFQSIHEDLTNEKDPILSLVAERLSSVLKYNVLGGKMIRGLTLVSAVEMLSDFELTPHEQKLSHILGWCIEILQGFFLVTDDVMDNGTDRRGKSCWFRLQGVGLQAINDALLLECSIYKLLKVHFHEMDCYMKILEEFHEMTEKTVWGQSLDMMGNLDGKPQLDFFKPEYYFNVIKHKTAFYSFCLPVRVAMHLVASIRPSCKFSEEHYTKVTDICLKLGLLFQIQDDFLDAYGDPNVIGKAGNDIREGKCTWLAVTALQCASQDDRRIMEEKYGVDDPDAVKEILKLYDSLDITKIFRQTEDKMYSEISSLISQLDETYIKRQLFVEVLDKMYKRKK